MKIMIAGLGKTILPAVNSKSDKYKPFWLRNLQIKGHSLIMGRH